MKDSEVLGSWAKEGRERHYLELDVILPDQVKSFKFYEVLERAAAVMRAAEAKREGEVPTA